MITTKLPKRVELRIVINTDNTQAKPSKVYDLGKEDVSGFFRQLMELQLESLNERSQIVSTLTEFSATVTEWDEVEVVPFKPHKVQVYSGDGTTSLGEGMYVGDVKVYCYRMPNGDLTSFFDCENEPDPAKAPEGGTLMTLPENPKIVLDKPLPDGRTVVYGCQTYWKPVGADDEKAAKASTN